MVVTYLLKRSSRMDGISTIQPVFTVIHYDEIYGIVQDTIWCMSFILINVYDLRLWLQKACRSHPGIWRGIDSSPKNGAKFFISNRTNLGYAIGAIFMYIFRIVPISTFNILALYLWWSARAITMGGCGVGKGSYLGDLVGRINLSYLRIPWWGTCPALCMAIPFGRATKWLLIGVRLWRCVLLFPARYNWLLYEKLLVISAWQTLISARRRRPWLACHSNKGQRRLGILSS